LKPDVLQGTDDDSLLFVGDGKDSANEDSSNSETLKRIQGYCQEFANHLGANGYKGGILAIATNSAEAATGWSDT